MRVLWVCNIMPPMVGQALGLECSVKEGWITGILEEMIERKEELSLGIAYPMAATERKEGFRVSLISERSGKRKGITCYEFAENPAAPEIYGGKELERRMEEIIKDFRPQLLHLFGTEYGHSLAAAKVFPHKEQILLGLQGIVTECALHYMAGLPEKIQRKRSLRDFLRQDSMKQQQEKFRLRGERENRIISLVGCITGRTEFDKNAAKKINPGARYFPMNETMRKEFYTGRWEPVSCRPYSIFFSQADYPLKGFHHLINAAGLLVKKYPSLSVRVAGNRITGYATLKEKIKISAYGDYLRKLIREKNLQDKIIFLGKLSAEEMKQEYLSCHCYVCASSIENSPNSMAEAMLLGTPVVASRTGGIMSMTEEGRESLLFTPGNYRQLAACIDKIWQEDTRTLTLSENARKRAHAAHNPQANYNRLMEIYEQML